jgi:signal peptidase II
VRGLQERRVVAALSLTPCRPRVLAGTLVLAGAVVAADQVTKSLAESKLAGHAPVHLLGPLGFDLSFNSGSAFSLFTGRTVVHEIVAAALVVAVVVAAWRATGWLRGLSLGLILGGALGNLADRTLRGHHGSVVDFVTLSHWPTFNVADSAITVGAILLAWSLFRVR